MDEYNKSIQYLQERWQNDDDNNTNNTNNKKYSGCSIIDIYSLVFNTSLHLAATNPLHSNRIIDITMITFNRIRYMHQKISFFHYPKILQIGITALSHDVSTASTTAAKDKRYQFISQIIKDCQRDGFVSRFFFHILWTGPIKYITHNNNQRTKIYYTNRASTIGSNKEDEDNEELVWTIEDSQNIIKEFFPVWPIPSEYTRNVKLDIHKVREKDLYERDTITTNSYKYG
jgi:hypothetical protein